MEPLVFIAYVVVIYGAVRAWRESGPSFCAGIRTLRTTARHIGMFLKRKLSRGTGYRRKMAHKISFYS